MRRVYSINRAPRQGTPWLALLMLVAQFQIVTATEPTALRIAVPASMIGPRAAAGKSVHEAAIFVASRLNASHAGLQVEIVAVDDVCNSADAGEAAESLASRGFDAVIGFSCRASARAAATVFTRTGQILLATAPLVPPLDQARHGPTVFHLPVAQESLAQFLGASFASTPAHARIVVIRDRTRQATAQAAAVIAGVGAVGRVVAATEVFNGGDKAFGPIVARMKATGATHAALLAYPVEGGLFAAELARAIPDIEIIAADQFAAADAPLIAGAATSRVRVVLPAGNPLGATATSHDLRAHLQARNVTSGAEALVIAAAIESYVDAVRRAKSSEPAKVAVALRAPSDSPVPYGGGAFDARGHRVVPYWALFHWDADGRLVEAP